MTRILVVQGANLIHLGKREPEIYGTTSREDVDTMIQEHARSNGYLVDIFYTNIEGAALDRIYQAADSGTDGLLMNPAGFTYAGYALKDCVKAVQLPYVEVHISNVEARGIKSVLADVADGVVFGFGIYGYILGLQGLLHVIGTRKQEQG